MLLPFGLTELEGVGLVWGGLTIKRSRVKLEGSGEIESGVSSTIDTNLGLGAMKEGALEAETESVGTVTDDVVVVDLEISTEVASGELGFPEVVDTKEVVVDVMDVEAVVVVSEMERGAVVVALVERGVVDERIYLFVGVDAAEDAIFDILLFVEVILVVDMFCTVSVDVTTLFTETEVF